MAKKVDRIAAAAALGVVRKYFAVPRALTAPDDGITITTMALDLENDRVFPEGAELQTYLKNPVVLWLHDSYGSTESAGIPIGTSRSLEVVPGVGIRATGIDWLEGDPFADRIRNAFEQGKVRGASIGFIPTEHLPNEHGGYDILKWKLLEWSLVPIPANPDAVRRVAGPRGDFALALKALGAEVEVVERSDLAAGRVLLPAMSKSILPGGDGGLGGHPRSVPIDPDTPIRWNRHLSKTFDVVAERIPPSTLEYGWVSRYLDVPVKDLAESGTMVPSAKMGSFLSALQEELTRWKVETVRNLTWEGKECPPVHEMIQLNSTRRQDFLVEGLMFLASMQGQHTLVLKLIPEWGELYVRSYVPLARKADVDALFDRVWERARELNYLKGEAFSLSGEFLPKTDESWDDLFLDEKNAQALRRALELINTKGAAMPNRGILLLGPPGTGKTLSGRVLLNEAQATFLWVSARDFYRAGAYGGLTYAFSLARECAPTILFIEDVDNWLGPYTIDLLKTEMDGIGRSAGILTILTTNYPELLPDALIDRPGRFHDVLRLELPDEAARQRMLGRWLPELEGQLDAVVVATAGYSGAHVRELANFARTICEQEGCPLPEAVTRALQKLVEQRELITEVQTAGSRYRPSKAVQEAVIKTFGRQMRRKAEEGTSVQSVIWTREAQGAMESAHVAMGTATKHLETALAAHQQATTGVAAAVVVKLAPLEVKEAVLKAFRTVK